MCRHLHEVIVEEDGTVSERGSTENKSDVEIVEDALLHEAQMPGRNGQGIPPGTSDQPTPDTPAPEMPADTGLDSTDDDAVVASGDSAGGGGDEQKNTDDGALPATQSGPLKETQGRHGVVR